MTDAFHRAPGPGDHLDDERLSDLLDGRGAPGDADHVAGCPDCGSRLARWRLVAERVGGPVPQPGGVRRHDAVGAALAAALGAGALGAEAPPADRVAGAPPAGAAPLRGRPPARRRAAWRWGAGLAAAAAAVGAAGFGLSQLHGSPASTTASRSSTASPVTSNSASAPSAGSSSSAGVGAGGAAAGLGPAALSEPRNLGYVSGPAALAAAASRLGQAPGVSYSSSNSASTTPVANGMRARCPVPTAVAGTAVGPSTPLVQRAAADYAGTPADVFVFATGTATSSRHTVVAEAVTDCRVIATAGY